ncbi:LPD7 domain-containing protein [Pantoea agglomerans]
MKTADYPVWLAVLPDQRTAARSDAGIHSDGHSAISWDKEAQLWYARPGADLSRLQKWMPDRSIRSSGGGDPQSEFFDALTSAGLVLDGLPVMDGQRHRVPVVDGKKGNRDGVYRGFLDGVKPGGWYINYHRADNEKDITRWKASGSTGEADPLARVHIRAVMRQSQDDFAREQAALYAQQTAKAQALYSRLPAADPAHGYLERKGITVAEDVRQTRNGALVVPFHDADGAFRTLQYIPPDGEKYLFKDAPKAGHFRVEGGELSNGEPILYAEGYATARSLYMVTGRPVVMTIDAGNMETVASVLKARYPDSPHLFMADVDHSKDINKGVLSANRAAAATGGVVLLPDLTATEIEQGFTDFNDLHLSRGAERLRETLLPHIAQALEQLNYKDAPMATPDDAQPAADNISAAFPDALPETVTARRPGAAKDKTGEILKLRDEGLKPAQIAKQLGIGQTSVYRILKAQQPEAAASSATPEPASADLKAVGVNDLPAASPSADRETITLYHGSPATFSAIDPEKIGLGQNFMGRGFYTDNSVTGVHYAMEEINHPDYHVYELEIPSHSVILDRWDSSSLTDALRERIRDAGKKVDQQLTEKGETTRLGIGDSLADCEKIDASFFKYADSPEGMRILKEAGIDALKDNSYVAIVNTDLIDNVRLRSAEGNLKAEMTQYVDNALVNVDQDSSRLSSLLQDNPENSIYYHAIRLELLKLAKAQDKPEEAERLTSLLTHTLIETIESSPDKKTSITPLNRLYAEAIRSLDLNHDDSAVTLGHLIDSAVVSINPNQKRVVETDKPESAVPEQVAAVPDIPATEASLAAPLAATDATPAHEPIVALSGVAEQAAAPATVPESPGPASVATRRPEPAAVHPDVNVPQPAPQVTASEANAVSAPTVALASPEPSGPYDGYTGLYGTGAELRDRLAALASGQISPEALLQDISTLRSRVVSAAITDVYTREHVKEMREVFDRVTQGGIAGADVMATGGFSRLRGLLGQRDTWSSLHPTGGTLDVNTVPDRIAQQYALLARGDVTRAQFDREVRMLYNEFTRADPGRFTPGRQEETRAMFERMVSLESPERAAQYSAGMTVIAAQLPPASAADTNATALYRIQAALRDEFVSLARGESTDSALTENVARLQAQLDEAKAQGVYADGHLTEVQGAFDRVTQGGLAGMPSPDAPAPRGDFASRNTASASLDVATVPARIEAQYGLLVRGEVTRAQFEDNLAVLRNEVLRLSESGRVIPAALSAAEVAFTNLSALRSPAEAAAQVPLSAAVISSDAPSPEPATAPATISVGTPSVVTVSEPAAATEENVSAPQADALPSETTSLDTVTAPHEVPLTATVSVPMASASPVAPSQTIAAQATAADARPESADRVPELSHDDATSMAAESNPQTISTPGTPLTSAFGPENGILVGAPRVAPQDEDAPASSGATSSRIDADKLLTRVTHDKHPDGKSVVYKLDGEPAFIDRGNRLVMAEGASAHEEKVLAALLTAANHYQGRIELTGSDEFKAFAIGVIVANKLDVAMKNASQQADLDAARRAAGQPVTPVAPADAVRGDPQAMWATEAPPGTSPAQADVPVQNAAPVTESRQRTSEPAAPRISPAVHTPAEKAREPVTGKVTACGQAPFRFEPGESESTFITLRTKEGPQTFWGKELAGLLRETNLKPGRTVTLQWQGEQPVTINKPLKDAQGNFTGRYQEVETKRNQWSLSPAGGDRVRTGGDELVSLAAVDVNRYTQIQHTLVSRHGLNIDAPPKPADGLYWLKPDGQGSSRPGDPLSAPRPAHNDRAGVPVMSSWGKDGQPDLLLVQGDGDYLQGVVRQNGTYQHVLVSLPDSAEAPPMVVNLLTPEGAQPIGNGNGINRSNGQPVSREHVVVRLTGDAQQRIAKLDAPADVPAALHARLGYDERYKAESGWVKEAPAAAPQAVPATPPRPAQ